MLTSCDSAVPTTCQQDVFASCNRLVASLSTSCDNAVPTTCEQDVSSTGLQHACYKQVMTMLFQQLVNKMSPQQACSKLVINKL